MNDQSQSRFSLPPEQQAIRDQCFHPSGTFVEFSPKDVETSIPARFEKIVHQFPDRLAVKTNERELTYDELNRRANRLAHYLISEHQTVQQPVGLFVNRWDELVVAHLAVLKSGNCSFALDLAAGIDRTAHLLADSGARIVLVDDETQKSARELLGGESAVINVNQFRSSCENNPNVQLPPESYAYIRYTSGSTGNAKGAAKTHRHVLKAVMDFVNYFHLCPEDRVTLLGFASIGKHLFKALLAGASLCPFDARKEGVVHLAEWLQEARTTVYFSFPTAFRYFVGSLSADASFPDLRLIELEGEPVYRRDVELFKRHFSTDCYMVNTLSSAETGTVCLYFLDKNISPAEGQVPVGYPVDEVEVLTLDEAGTSVGFDHVGEVAVRSRFLVDGYWRNAEATNKKFISQIENGSSRLYLTGDLGRISHDGCLQLLGRKDFQVKVRSFRVDVAEVEATLANHPEVKHVVVIGKKDRSENTRLVAYIVPKNRSQPIASILRSFLEPQLPEYMVPAAFVFLNELPLMSTGKINRRALPNPDRQRPELSTPMASPVTSTEKEIARIWAEVLALDEIGVNDKFWELGGHSLAASQIISRVVEKFQLKLSVTILFDSPTVAEMAALVMQDEVQGVDPAGRERIVI